MKFAIIFAALFASAIAEPIILQSPQVTNWGSWREWEYCPSGSYVVGMQLKTHAYQGAFKDDTSLNGIKFYCDILGSQRSDIYIASGQEDYGSFGNNYFCEGVATGFQLKSEKSQTWFADDTAANNLRMYCNSDDTKYLEGDGERFGDFTNLQQCFKKQAICGLQTQVEDKSAADPTALNNIRVKCCDVEDPAEVCIPEDVWELVIECDNTEAVTPTTCYYERKVGVSTSTTESEGGYYRSEIYHSLGFNLAAAISPLNLNFRYNLGISQGTGYDWSVSNTEIWSSETTTSVSFDVPSGIKTQLLQTVGKCDFYAAKATRVKRIDTDTKTNIQSITYFDF